MAEPPSRFEAQEKAMAAWLAGPAEFGVAPAAVLHRKVCHLITTYGPLDVHLLDYEMPDGTKGVGFVNPITWSFLGARVPEIPEDELITAYMGWAWLAPSIQSGKVLTKFQSSGEEGRFKELKAAHGFADVSIESRYKLGDSEIFAYRAQFDGLPVRGAGNTEAESVFDESDARFCIPPIYFLIGRQVVRRTSGNEDR